jgi:phage tail sheath protein FI
MSDESITRGIASGSGTTIIGAETSVTAFVGRTPQGNVNDPTLIESFADFEHIFGGVASDLPLTYAVRDFFQNDGKKAVIVRLTKPGGSGSGTLDVPSYLGSEEEKTGIYALLNEGVVFNLLCIPPDTHGGDVPPVVYQAALTLCVRQKAFLIVDPPAAWTGKAEEATAKALAGFESLGLDEPAGRNGAIYFPRVKGFDPMRGGEVGTFVPCGIVAGIMARTDANEGVWKAPAGTGAAINGIASLDVALNDDQNGQLNSIGINCLRTFPGIGSVVWGARTLRGSDELEDEYRYISVRRLSLYIETSLNQGLQWAMFEPNDAILWANITLTVENFMTELFREGAFAGATPKDSFFVQCDATTTSPEDIVQGIVNITIGFAPVNPAEYVVLNLEQIAGQSTD